MCTLKLSVVLKLSVASSHLKATPVETPQVETWKRNTATCATQFLAKFLVCTSNNFGATLSSTNMGPNTYGKRNTVEVLNREPLNYLPL
ncbi:PREDICTED: islet amyloid polypeptide [Hipposideros armiger]|uniref:Islet amyloid polypeptide n=1 Tax=Hipposideros armiger TaxID=186990 RepID=A0A8B7QAW1_HIPAR|nr:PREDICTED: islet amyloid polypeptide [Hipposideros armiger]